MSLLGLSLAYIRARALNAALNLALLALGVATIVLLLLFSAQLEDRLTRDARGIDLVIGSKGSPLQLILSSIYHVDFPTENIPLAEAERWAEHPLVAETIPLALGDSLAGFRVVGTERAYSSVTATSWPEAGCGGAVRSDARRATSRPGPGSAWATTSLVVPRPSLRAAEACASHSLHCCRRAQADRKCPRSGGASRDRERLAGPRHGTPRASRRSEARTSTLRSTTTIMRSTRARTTSEPAPGAVGRDAERPLEITSLLVRYKSPVAAVELPLLVNRESALQAASPAFETGASVVAGRYRRRYAARPRPAADRHGRAQRVHRAVKRHAGAALRSRRDARRSARRAPSCCTQPLLEALLLAGGRGPARHCAGPCRRRGA